MNNLPERITTADARLTAITAANRELAESPRALLDAWEHLRPLINYYESQWSADRAAYPHAQVGVLSEDGVWNEMGHFLATVQELQAATQRILSQWREGGEA